MYKSSKLLLPLVIELDSPLAKAGKWSIVIGNAGGSFN